jgi:hypothetical protein
MQNFRSQEDIAEIQIAGAATTGLPDADKREVWEEFYAANKHTPYQKCFQKRRRSRHEAG